MCSFDASGCSVNWGNHIINTIINLTLNIHFNEIEITKKYNFNLSRLTTNALIICHRQPVPSLCVCVGANARLISIVAHFGSTHRHRLSIHLCWACVCSVGSYDFFSARPPNCDRTSAHRIDICTILVSYMLAERNAFVQDDDGSFALVRFFKEVIACAALET